MKDRESIIRNYVEGYNQFDMAKMIMDFDEDVIFTNVSGGQVNLSIKGSKAFREQAEEAATCFSKRNQTITSIKNNNDESEVDIEYFAVLAKDLPNGLKKGQELNLTGRSIFKFSGNKITSLTDLS
jgi:hypothetical protein